MKEIIIKISTFWLFLLFGIIINIGCNRLVINNESTIAMDSVRIDSLLTNYHRMAAMANYNAYFNCYTDDAVFIGTDPTENWKIKSFKVWAKPYFDSNRTWNFYAISRNIYIDSSQKWANFDELLQTQMKICRGSGVVVKDGNVWKIKQYVISMTIPNENTAQVVKIKAPIEDSLLRVLFPNN